MTPSHTAYQLLVNRQVDKPLGLGLILGLNLADNMRAATSFCGSALRSGLSPQLR